MNKNFGGPGAVVFFHFQRGASALATEPAATPVRPLHGCSTAVPSHFVAPNVLFLA
jgi:hypothetical protein